ncbi:DEKNAAC105033 [Brettanomyces naardenensis]|uniref:DEKNAAC105033 n=1 Tax=Brettanomyces naardenensis TaxID=13370 RepID=A0A448YS82_BRENA|nr:DEKNAAC105033 [Brettanomyces naardenensis]
MEGENTLIDAGLSASSGDHEGVIESGMGDIGISGLDKSETRDGDDGLDIDSDDQSDAFQDSDSLLSSLATRILDEIRKGTYTCMVCTGDIDSSSKIWSCPVCSRVFDLGCIRDWSKRGSSTQADSSWRCPSCNTTLHQLPKHYTCWCGKVVNPAENPLSPHSCGQTCGVKMKRCVHGCPLECHPGPHAEKCTAMGPLMRCRCGRESRQLPCEITPYRQGWSCGHVCDDLMPCGLHKCPRTCHSGLCGPCKVHVRVKCYCGKKENVIECGERDPRRSEKVSDDMGTVTAFVGCFSCAELCGVLLDCGIHRCPLSCHPTSSTSHTCPRSPSALAYCPCGKSKILDLQSEPRTSCLDPVPTCGQVCGKRLPCGHKCYWQCHEGPCAPCYSYVDVSCRCAHTTYSVACALAQEGYQPVCSHRCQAKLSCRRHACGRQCCAYEQMALTRERARAKAIRRHVLDPGSIDDSTIEAVHICTEECGRVLSCGKHRCHAACHSGKCPPCLESSSVDLVCSCGRTVVAAPVRCGTELPICPYPCQRPKACGHPLEPHHCHPDNVSCPPCTLLVTRTCQCDKHIPVKNVMCSQNVVSCGKVCGKILSCGEHKCTKICHLPGQCQQKCTQPCGKMLPCGHKCRQKCHAPLPCDPKSPCRVLMTLKCPCGRKSARFVCSEVSNGRKLECDDECIREQRNKLLFEALKIGDSTKSAGISPELITQKFSADTIYTPYVLSLYEVQPVWCASIEKALGDLVNGRLGRDSHHFSPMRSSQRRFVRELSEAYHIFSESQDPEPKRSVFVKADRSSSRPRLSLREALTVNQKVKEAEEARAERQELTNSMRQNSQDKHESYNAIAIRDVFFGITRDKLEEATDDLWQLKGTFTTIRNGQIKWVSENTFIFYADNYKEKSTLGEAELTSLCGMFQRRLQERNLAMKCCLAKIDDSASILYEMQSVGKGEDSVKADEDVESSAIKRQASLDTSSFDWY